MKLEMLPTSIVTGALASLSVLILLSARAEELPPKPSIDLPEKEFDFGVLNEGVEVKHVFPLHNAGGKRLEIKTAFSTCGCTVPHIKHREIAPGQTGELEVMLDTSMKQGHVSKPIEIRCNDPDNPVVTIHIKANVRSAHADMGDVKAKIFTGRCAACHVEKGKGKQGEELFVADCGMCHGFRGTGIPGVAPSVVQGNYDDDAFSATIKHVISFGSPAHRSMAGYLDEAGGPLSPKDIDSIMAFLKKKSAQLKNEDARKSAGSQAPAPADKETNDSKSEPTPSKK